MSSRLCTGAVTKKIVINANFFENIFCANFYIINVKNKNKRGKHYEKHTDR